MANTKKPTNNPSEIDIAFTAGFLEGDGHFGKNNTTVEVSVVQKNPWILYVLQKWFGGSVKEVNRQGINKVTYTRWGVWGDQARHVMKVTFKYLSPEKQKQIKQLEEMYSETNLSR